MDWFTHLLDKSVLRVRQRIWGHSSPAIAGILNRIGLNYGIPPTVLGPLAERLNQHPSDIVRMGKEAADWARKYSALLEHLERESIDKDLDRQIRAAVRAGDFDGAVNLLNAAINSGAAGLEQRASRHYHRAALHDLQFRPQPALADYAEAHRYQPENAAYAYAHALALQEQHRFDEALEAYQTALSAALRPDAASPEASLPYAAAALNNLGSLQARLHPPGYAEASFREALALRRQLAAAKPGRYLPDLAATLDNLGRLCRNAGRLREADETLREALAVRRRLAEAAPEMYLPDVAMSQTGLGLLYADTGRMADAEDMFREALSAYRRLDETDPLGYRSERMTALNHLEALYAYAGREREADAVRKELDALARRARVAADSSAHKPTRFRPGR